MEGPEAADLKITCICRPQPRTIRHLGGSQIVHSLKEVELSIGSFGEDAGKATNGVGVERGGSEFDGRIKIRSDSAQQRFGGNQGNLGSCWQ